MADSPSARRPLTVTAVPAGSSSGTLVTLAPDAFAARAAAVGAACRAHERIALWAEPALETIVAIAGAWQAGSTIIPLNPSLGTRELTHVLETGRPRTLVAPVGAVLPDELCAMARVHVDVTSPERPTRTPGVEPRAGDATEVTESRPLDGPALILFTSGTSGPPKGVVLSAAAIAANLDGLRQAWQWDADDVLVHALPLFHVHGLVLGVLGPLLIGGGLVHAGRFAPGAIASALAGGGTMLFGVPTMYHRLADAAETEPAIADALRSARLLISGSAPLARRDADRLQSLTGRAVIERYGLTETLIVCATPAGRVRPGHVGPPVPGVQVRLVDDRGIAIDACETPGEVEVRGPCLFDGYLDQPEATAGAFAGGWFRTGDTAERTHDGDYRIVGRTSLDIIKTGGFKVGAGEIEEVLRQHPDVEDAAVTGEADVDLGQRIVAWIEAAPGAEPNAEALSAYVASQLAPHKRPRAVHLIERLPRTALGKIEKHRLLARAHA